MQDIKQQHRALLLLFATLMIGQLILAVVLYFLTNKPQSTDYTVFRLLIPVLTLLMIITTQWYYRYEMRKRKPRLRSLKQNDQILDTRSENYSLSEIENWFNDFQYLKKVQIYTVFIFNIFVLLLWLLTNSPYYFLYFFIGMAYFALINPFLVNFYSDFNLNENEIKLIENRIIMDDQTR